CAPTGRSPRASASAVCSTPRACRSGATGWTCVRLASPELKPALNPRGARADGHPMARARVSTPLADPVRLSMLRATSMLGTPPEEGFDRLAGLARKVLKTPVAMVALLDDRHLHVKACIGQPELAKARR